MSEFLQMYKAFFIAVLLISPMFGQQPSLTAKNVHLLWRTSLKVDVPPSTTPAINSHAVFIVSSGTIRAFGLDTGILLWKTQLLGYVPTRLSADENAVFVPEATLHTIDEKTGHLIWEFKPDANASLGRALLQGNIIYFGTSSHSLYALRISDRKNIWTINLGQNWKFPAVVRGIAYDSGVLYVTAEQWRTINGTEATGWLFALDAKTGKIIWRFSTGSDQERRGLSSSPTITPTVVLACDYLSNAILAINKQTGKLVWRFEATTGYVGFPEAPLVNNNIVYAGSGDTYFYALDLSSGDIVWRTKLKGAIQAYAFCGNNLLVNSGELSVLDPISGTTTQTFWDSGSEFISSDIVAIGTRAYMTGPQGVYAFSCK